MCIGATKPIPAADKGSGSIIKCIAALKYVVGIKTHCVCIVSLKDHTSDFVFGSDDEDRDKDGVF